MKTRRILYLIELAMNRSALEGQLRRDIDEFRDLMVALNSAVEQAGAVLPDEGTIDIKVMQVPSLALWMHRAVQLQADTKEWLRVLPVHKRNLSYRYTHYTRPMHFRAMGPDHILQENWVVMVRKNDMVTVGRTSFLWHTRPDGTQEVVKSAFNTYQGASLEAVIEQYSNLPVFPMNDENPLKRSSFSFIPRAA